ncbi:Pyruvate kinase [Fasciola gigantica]|uniref:Pyruvate kinase n=1 Tax=Fasciola gigantica TaxID=46835 RepID=A0A504YSI6_FASGI|nr:Pyruvate kinase [Fasciola gigantica]
MNPICQQAEAAMFHGQLLEGLKAALPRLVGMSHFTVMTAMEAASLCNECTITVVTTSGGSSPLTSKRRPRCTFPDATTQAVTASQANPLRGMHPVY